MTAIRRGRVHRLRGADVHVLNEGAGPVVVCLSGVAGAWYDWQPLADRLLPGHRVVRPDRPGAGLSGPPGDVLRAATEADRLADLVASLGAGPVTVVAHSLGAPIGEVFARRHPRLVAALVLVDGSIEEEPSGRSAAQAAALARRARRLAVLSGARVWAPWARTVVDARTGGASSVASAALRAAARAVYGRAEVVAGIATELAGYRSVVDEALAARAVAPLASPVTVVAAQRSTGSPGRWVRRQLAFAERLRAEGAEVRVEILRGCGHLVMLECPDALAAIVAAAVRRGVPTQVRREAASRSTPATRSASDGTAT